MNNGEMTRRPFLNSGTRSAEESTSNTVRTDEPLPFTGFFERITKYGFSGRLRQAHGVGSGSEIDRALRGGTLSGVDASAREIGVAAWAARGAIGRRSLRPSCPRGP